MDPTDKNISAIYEHQKAEKAEVPWTHKIAHRFASFSGSVKFIFIHAVLFAAWIIFNTAFKELKVDPYPFTMLTTIVSLESIFLTAFVMLSQNELSAQAERQHQLDLQVNLLAEQENTAMIKVLVLMAAKLGIPEKEVQELLDLADDVDPQEMLEKIKEVEKE